MFILCLSAMMYPKNATSGFFASKFYFFEYFKFSVSCDFHGSPRRHNEASKKCNFEISGAQINNSLHIPLRKK